VRSKWVHEIPGYEEYKGYKVFENGDVASYKAMKSDGSSFHHYISDDPQRILKSCSDGSKGYLRVDLQGKRRKTTSVHRLVTLAFIPNPDNKPQVNHIEANKENNHVNNLEWVTGLENHHHKLKMGLNVSLSDDDHYTRKSDKYKNWHHARKKVQQLDLNNNPIQIFNSVKEASEHVGVHFTTIVKALDKSNRTAGGFKWLRFK
jgi:hypothetical protein